MRTTFRVLAIVCFMAALGVGMFNLNQVTKLQKQIASLETSVQSLAQGQASTSAKVNLTEQKVSQQIAAVNKQVAPVVQSQDQLLTAAVAKAAPTVVSIVISAQVPNLQVTYENPFGSDPLFKDFGFQIPVYHQQGSTLQKVGAGSGFIISKNGYILTNKHVVSDETAQYTVLLSNGMQKNGIVVYRDPNSDVAILKIDGTFNNVATLGDSSAVKLGQSVVAIGNALGEYSNSVSVGIISGLNRSIEAANPNGTTEELSGVIQTDASINPGNSGGPLIDLTGKVIGVNVATIYGSSNISFSIPINTIKGIIAGYI